MIVNYKKKLIWDYINGEEIPNIDELEADYKFLMEVIRTSQDKKVYNLCSESIKNNYEFIKFIIETFKDDKKFIIKVADEYLKKVDSEDIRYQELIFLICELNSSIRISYDDELISYYLKRCTIYAEEKNLIGSVLAESELEIKKEIGTGFAYILYDKFSDSEIIIRYFAQKFVEEIFYENDELTLEDLIHQHFSNYEKLKEMGIRKYILNYVNYQDESLAEYLSLHLDLIKGIEQSIIKVGLNWNNYLERQAENNQEQFEVEVNQLIEKYKATFTYEEVCYYLKKININLPLELDDDIYYNENFDEYESMTDFIDENNIYFRDYKCLQEIKKLAQNILAPSDGQKLLASNKVNNPPMIKPKKARAKVLSFNSLNQKRKFINPNEQ